MAIAVKSVCIPDTGGGLFTVTNDPDVSLGSISDGAFAVAIALGAVTNGNYAFFQTGGVIGEEYVSTLGGTYPTDDSVVAGRGFRAEKLTADALGFGILAAATDVRVGYALANDG